MSVTAHFVGGPDDKVSRVLPSTPAALDVPVQSVKPNYTYGPNAQVGWFDDNGRFHEEVERSFSVHRYRLIYTTTRRGGHAIYISKDIA